MDEKRKNVALKDICINELSVGIKLATTIHSWLPTGLASNWQSFPAYPPWNMIWIVLIEDMQGAESGPY